jgi:tyrosinase
MNLNLNDTFSAFDPIFWLHHANVDRMLSLWQAMYPDIWVTPGENVDATMSIAPMTIVNNDTRMSNLLLLCLLLTNMN